MMRRFKKKNNKAKGKTTPLEDGTLLRVFGVFAPERIIRVLCLPKLFRRKQPV